MAATGLEKLVEEECFSVENITNHVYLIKENFNKSMHGKCNIWLSKGTSLDVVIDTGLGIWDLVGFLKSKGLIGNKPYMAIATHIHFDHAGGLYQFESTAIHKDEHEDMKNGNNVIMASYLRANDVTHEAGFNAKDYRVRGVAPTKALQDNDIIDQGSHQLQVVHLPGHTKGSIALYDIQNRYLYVGDVLYDGMLVDFVPTSSISEYTDSCRRLKEMASNVELVFPGHERVLSGTEMGLMAQKYIEDGGKICHKGSRLCLKCLVISLIKSRNTGNVAFKCLYYSCCCCFCL